MPRKPRSTSQGALAMSNSSISPLSIVEAANNSHSDFVVSEGCGMVKIEVSSGSVSQALVPLSTIPLKIYAQPGSQTSRYLLSCKISCCVHCVENINCIFPFTGHIR